MSFTKKTTYCFFYNLRIKEGYYSKELFSSFNVKEKQIKQNSPKILSDRKSNRGRLNFFHKIKSKDKAYFVSCDKN